MSQLGEMVLYFDDSEAPQLQKTTFQHPLLRQIQTTTRGSCLLPAIGGGSFTWTAGVKAFCILVIRSIIEKDGGSKQSGYCNPFFLSGNALSPAASFDYSLSKKPAWLMDMFGVDSTGIPLAVRLFRRTNPERKRPGPVCIALNYEFLPISCIKMVIGEKPASTEQSLHKLVEGIEKSWKRGAVEVRNRRNVGSPSFYEGLLCQRLTQKSYPNITTELPSTDEQYYTSSIFGEIAPASDDDIEQIHEYEKIQFPGAHATKDRLLEWRSWDPNNFVCIRLPGESIMGYFIILFLNSSGLSQFTEGRVDEDDLGSKHLCDPYFDSYLKQSHMHIVVVASKNHFSFLTVELVWNLIGRILMLAEYGKLQFVTAEIESSEGSSLIERFGFKALPLGQKRSKPLYQLSITPSFIKEWKGRYAIRSFACNK